MAVLSFRPFDVSDPARIVSWYKEDRSGFELFMGREIPDNLALTLQLNTLLDAAKRGWALFYMVTHGDETIGFCGLTNVTPDRFYGQPHIYVEPGSRRFSIRVSKQAELLAKQYGVRCFLSSIESQNKRGLALMKALGYNEVPRRTFLKEL